MKSSLDHLPATKQRELEHIKAVLMAEFEAALDAVTGCTAGSGSLDRLLLDRRQELERELARPRERAKSRTRAWEEFCAKITIDD